MVLVEFAGCCLVGVGCYVAARPMSVRSFPSGEEWTETPERAEQEQRAYATMVAACLILSGVGLVGYGLLGSP